MSGVDRRSAQSYVRFRLGQDDLPLGVTVDAASPIERALKLSATIMNANGATKAGSIDFFPDPTVIKDRSGASTVTLHQICQGLPIFEAQQVTGFRADGSVDLVQSRVTPVVDQPTSDIKVRAEAALAIALGAAASDEPRAPPGASITLLAEFSDLPERPMLFSLDSVAEPVRAHLLWFPLQNELELAWHFDLAIDSLGEAYRMIVSAVDGAVLYSSLASHGLGQSGLVFTLSPEAERVELGMPRPWTSYPVPPPNDLAAAPEVWATADGTQGYSVEAFDADTKQPFVGTTADTRLRLAPADPDGQDQRLVNAFYACAMMHDFARILGFGPEEGAYDSHAVFGGTAGKPIRVAVSTEPVLSVANWWRGTIRLGPHPSGRHSSLDVTVVAHEYMHAVSNRLVGGGLDNAPLVAPQSRGMAEGWSDYFACIVTRQNIIGAWLAMDAVKGLRRFAYDANFPADQANLGMLATLSTYEIGELWCAFLCETTRHLGVGVAPLLILDGMKGLLSNPSLIDARDNILLKLNRWQAAGILDPDSATAHEAAVRRAAARFGMGPKAKTSGAGLEGATADFMNSDV